MFMESVIRLLFILRIDSMDINEINLLVKEADKVLVGLGKNVSEKEQLEKVANILAGKDYYVVSMSEDHTIFNSGIDGERLVAPFTDTTTEEEWNKYLDWLSKTLNKSLLVVEIEVAFEHPEVIRFPFEKTVLYNNKAQMIRINSLFPQVPAEIKDKANGYKMSAIEFLK